MEWLNYHHLFYLWTIAREGSLTKASARLHGIRERYYAISVERKARHPATAALIDSARVQLRPPGAAPPARARRVSRAPRAG